MSKQFYFKQFGVVAFEKGAFWLPSTTVTNFTYWPIDKTLSGANTLSQSGLGSNGNKGILHISQNFSITGTSPSDCLVSYPGYSFGGGESLTPLQRCSWCILQPQPTGQPFLEWDHFLSLV